MNNITLATINSAGIIVADLPTVTLALQQNFQQIYGTGINIDSNSQAGQEIGIFAQYITDILQVAVDTYNSFDPDAVIGTRQDTLYAINGIERQGATYTIQDVQITVNQSITLAGLDSAINDPNGVGYTVSDNAGNQFILASTINLTPGTYTLEFRAANLGNITTTPNTITTPVSVILGVIAINNSTGATTLGLSEEPDSIFRLRRTQSTSLSSVGILDGLQAALLNIPGVVDAKVYENVSNVTDANGIPAHSIWVIVEGGSSTTIAKAIYAKISFGAGTKGAIAQNITTSSGQILTFLYDNPVAENLFIKFNIKTTIPNTNFNIAAIQNYIIVNTIFTIGQSADTANLTAKAFLAINTTSGGGIPLDLQISLDGSTWTDYLNVATLASKWSLSTSNIAITVIP